MVFDVFMYSLINPVQAFREVHRSKSKGMLAFLLAFAVTLALGAIGYRASVKYISGILAVFVLLMLGTLFVALVSLFAIKSFHGVREHITWESEVSKNRIGGYVRSYDVRNIRDEGFTNLFVKFLVSSIPINLLIGIGMLLHSPAIAMITGIIGMIWSAYVFAEGEAKTINLPFTFGFRMGVFNSIMVLSVYGFVYLLMSI